jgi:anti-sigma B factor antagonist
MSSLQISKREVDGVLILDLNGPITIGQGNIDLHRSIRALIEQDHKRILLNLAKVTYIDSSGLGELVAGFTSVEKNGGEIKMVNLTDRVTELMMITKLLTVFDVYDDEKTAISKFKPDPEDLETSPLEPVASKANSIA